ncbi:MAG: ankyrin [Planctomycetaceae bacterium]|nr:ankyrin [Planctomycetaceae bacterium]
MQIHLAAKRGDNSAIERQLQRGVSVDVLDQEGKTPLMCAVESGHAGLSTVRLLVANGADVNAFSSQFLHSVESHFLQSVLDLAAEAGKPDIVRFLLDAGANPCFVNGAGCTAIGCAMSDDPDHQEVLEILLEAGASPDILGHPGESHLADAMRCGNFQTARILLKYDPRREPANLSPLSWTIALGSVDEVAAELARYGESAAIACAEPEPWQMAMLTGEIAKAELLIKYGANLNADGSHGRTSLTCAVSRNHAELTQWLLEHGADPQEQDDLLRTALMEAVAHQAADCVRVLLRAGVPLENSNREHAIALARDIDVVRALVEAGADIDAVGDWDAGIPDGHWPLYTAAEMGDLQFARQLLKLGANPRREFTGETALHKAAARDHLAIVELLIQHGADVNAEECDGYTPLSGAQSLECVELLLAAGADIHVKNIIGVEVIGQHRDLEIIERLRAAGGTLESPDSSTGSLMMTAAQEGNVELVDHLLQQNVDANTPTSLEVTPLMAAAERGHTEVLRRLIEAGVDAHARDYRGRTALYYAAVPETGLAFQIYQDLERLRPQIMDDMLANIPENMQDAVRKSMANIPVPVSPMGYSPSDDVTAIDLLVQAGADLEALDIEGATPLLVACRHGRPARVARLLQLGANRQAINDQGRTARDMAAEHLDAKQGAEILKHF